MFARKASYGKRANTEGCLTERAVSGMMLLEREFLQNTMGSAIERREGTRYEQILSELRPGIGRKRRVL